MILDGKAYSNTRKQVLKEKVEQLKARYHVTPTIAIVLVGIHPASEIYARNKVKAAAFCGLHAEVVRLPDCITEAELLSEITKLNQDDCIHGIIVQLPLPKHLDERSMIDAIDVIKDVDGFGTLNKGRLFCGLPALVPATPQGVMYLLAAYNIPLEGKEAVVVGRSNIVGKPMALLLLEKNATVTIAHSKTKDLQEVTKRADILIVAIGKDRFIGADMVKAGAVVIDVGMNRTDNKLYGDVDFENVVFKAAYITPVPGGVGPLTITTLLENTVTAYSNIMGERYK